MFKVLSRAEMCNHGVFLPEIRGLNVIHPNADDDDGLGKENLFTRKSRFAFEKGYIS